MTHGQKDKDKNQADGFCGKMISIVTRENALWAVVAEKYAHCSSATGMFMVVMIAWPEIIASKRARYHLLETFAGQGPARTKYKVLLHAKISQA
jgi:hypothetical protein